MRNIAFFLLTLSMLLASCQEKEPETPSYLLSEDQMVDVMVDMHLLETAQNLKLMGADTTNRKYQQYFNAIFESHETSKADFDSSLFYYSTKTDQMNAIYDKVLEELYEMESEVKSDQ